MALILCIETTTTNCSVALAHKGKLVALKEYNSQKYSHAEKLHPFIEEVLQNGGFRLEEIEAVAISQGPGSYTGLRIGTSAAKGLSFALNIPLIAIETLDLLVEQSTDKTYDFVIPMLDARRMEVYTAIYDLRKNTKTPTVAKILDQNSFNEVMNKGKVLCIGNGVQKFKEICEHKNANFIESLPSSKQMVKLAQLKFERQAFEDIAYFEPYYLKDFIGNA